MGYWQTWSPTLCKARSAFLTSAFAAATRNVCALESFPVAILRLIKCSPWSMWCRGLRFKWRQTETTKSRLQRWQLISVNAKQRDWNVSLCVGLHIFKCRRLIFSNSWNETDRTYAFWVSHNQKKSSVTVIISYTWRQVCSFCAPLYKMTCSLNNYRLAPNFTDT